MQKGAVNLSVYVDVAFLVNFLFDAEIIFLTLTVTSKKINFLRIVLSAFLGGLYGVLVFFPYFRILSKPPISFLILLVIIYTALKPSSVRELFESYIVFLVIAFLLGGAMSFLNVGIILGLLLIFPLYLAIINIRKKIFKKTADVIIRYKGREIEKKGIYDSGNKVFYFGKPVIFGSKKLLFEILGDNCFNEEPQIPPEDLCIVAYSSIGKSGTIKGIRLDKAVVSKREFCGTVICFFDNDLYDEVILNGIMI